VEGGWSVETQVHGGILREGDGGDVLILRGVKIAHDADEIDNGADVGGVEASAGELGITGGVDEVGVGTAGERGDDGLTVAVVEESLRAGLSEAGELDVDRLLEAIRIGFEGEGAGEQVGMFEEIVGVGWWNAADAGEIFFDARLLEAGFDEILLGSDEDAGLAFDGGAKGGEVAAGFWCEEEHGLLSFGGDDDEGTFFANFFIPGGNADEPIVGWRVGGAAQEDADEQIVNGLCGREIGMQPDAVAGLEIGNRGNGKRGAVAGDTDVDARTGEIEAGVCSAGRMEDREHRKKH